MPVYSLKSEEEGFKTMNSNKITAVMICHFLGLKFMIQWLIAAVPSWLSGIKMRGTKPHRLQGTTKRPCTSKTKPTRSVALCWPLYIENWSFLKTGRANAIWLSDQMYKAVRIKENGRHYLAFFLGSLVCTDSLIASSKLMFNLVCSSFLEVFFFVFFRAFAMWAS